MIDDRTWAEVDQHILANEKFAAIKLIREKVASLAEVLPEFYRRYALLRETSPERFDCSEADYWEGFCS